MYCSNCGKELSDGARFCSDCGTKTADNITVEATPIQVVLPEQSKSNRPCPRCKSTNVQFQTVTESRKTGCFKVFLYIFLAVSVIGWLVLIPLMLRRKTNTVTYGVCQSCGNRWRV
ncbi:MAG: zinc ribbon domain-containing protein [Oscillospiraceae bacterium]|nr:zinc ribbon domain-containing protein [Oscillospiraceae bacterium]